MLTTQVHSLDPGRADPIRVSNSDGRWTPIPFPSSAKIVKVTRVWNDVGGTTATRGAVATTTLGYGLVTQFTY